MKTLITFATILAFHAVALGHVNIDFDDLTAPGPQYGSGAGFTNRGIEFTGATYSGWTYSNVNDTTTPGFTNQYASFTGTGFDSGDDNYAISFGSTRGETRITLGHPTEVHGMFVTNTTYAALSMLNGDLFAKQFGGPSGDDPDYFRLNVFGVDDQGNDLGSVTVDLADYTSADNSKDYVLDNWRWVDLSSFGGEVAALEFSLESSDVGKWGINTPNYFAMDNLVVGSVPEPTTVGLMGLGVVGLLLRRRRSAA